MATPRNLNMSWFSALAHRVKTARRSLLYGGLSIFMAIAIVVSQPQVSLAIPRFGGILIQGIQLLQLANMSDQQEVALGQQVNQQLLRQREMRLYTDPNVNRYVNQIGQRLAAKSSRSNIPYVFQVVDDKAVNAFATLGGYVYVNTGLIQLADNEAQLASVMSHEIGHIAARHAVKQMRQSAIAQGLSNVTGLDNSALVRLGTEVAVKRRSSRQHEFEADELGLNTLTSANYAPGAMIDFFNKLISNSNGKSVPTFLSTHPSTPDRVKALESSINPSTAYVGDGLNNQAYKVGIRPL